MGEFKDLKYAIIEIKENFQKGYLETCRMKIQTMLLLVPFVNVNMTICNDKIHISVEEECYNLICTMLDELLHTWEHKLVEIDY